MLRFFILRFVLPLIAFLIIRALLKSVWASANASVAPKSHNPAPDFKAGGELLRDPVCGTYVAANASVTTTVNGKTLHFCSATCRDQYRSA